MSTHFTNAALTLLLLASKPILAELIHTASVTTTAGISEMTSATLKLAKTYTGTDFLTDFGMSPSFPQRNHS